MSEYIAVPTLIEALTSKFTQNPFFDAAALTLSIVKELPTVDIEPVKHGQWIEGGESIRYQDVALHDVRCPECRRFVTKDIDEVYEYCPHCGARMEEEE